MALDGWESCHWYAEQCSSIQHSIRAQHDVEQRQTCVLWLCDIGRLQNKITAQDLTHFWRTCSREGAAALAVARTRILHAVLQQVHLTLAHSTGSAVHELRLTCLLLHAPRLICRLQTRILLRSRRMQAVPQGFLLPGRHSRSVGANRVWRQPEHN